MRVKNRIPPRRQGEEFRPTLARVRDAIFNSLAARTGGARVLDLYAGSGSLGIEALRRGAEHAVFVEHHPKLAAALRLRLVEEQLADRAEVWRRDALGAVRDLGLAGRTFEVSFLDPPYGRRLLAGVLGGIAAAGILAPGGVVAAEGHWRDRPTETGVLVCRREARYGETMVWYFEQAGGDVS